MTFPPSDEAGSLISALARCQAQFPPIVKGHDNPAFKGSKYADVADVLQAVRPILAREGIVITQSTRVGEEGGVTLVTTLTCAFDDFEMTSEFPLYVAGLTAQQVGSLITYHKRYQTCAILGVHPVGDDDDGNLAATATPEPVEAEDVARSREALQEAIAGLSDADKELVKLEVRNQRVPSLKKPGATRAQLDGLADFLAGLKARAEPFGTWVKEPEGDASGAAHPAEEERPPFEPGGVEPVNDIRDLTPGARASVRRNS